MQLLDGKYVSEKLKVEIAEEAAKILQRTGRQPHLVAVLVGHDGGSETYVASKMKNCEKVGFKSTLVRYEDDVTEDELLKKVEELNADADIDGGCNAFLRHDDSERELIRKVRTPRARACRAAFRASGARPYCRARCCRSRRESPRPTPAGPRDPSPCIARPVRPALQVYRPGEVVLDRGPSSTSTQPDSSPPGWRRPLDPQ